MGGAAGHILHPVEDMSLRFKDLKEMLKLATSGKLENVQEKLDGANIMFTWSELDEEVRFARNKSDLASGGMSRAGVEARFADREAPRRAYLEAHDVITRMMMSLSPQDRVKVFGPRGSTWLSAEVIFVALANTIQYGTNSIVFHQQPVLHVDVHGTITHVEGTGEVVTLIRQLDKLQAAIAERNWRVFGPIIVKLKDMSSGKTYTHVVREIDDAMDSVGTSDDDTLLDHVRAFARDEARRRGVPDDLVSVVADKIAGVKGTPNIRQLEKQAGSRAQIVREIVDAKKSVVDAALAPISRAVTTLAIEVLNNISSILVVDPRAETERIRARLKKISDAVAQGRASPAAVELFRKYSSALKDDLSRALITMEGIIFPFKGSLYKFTGAFQHIHQVLALATPLRGDDMIKIDEVREHSGNTSLFDEVENITLSELKEVWHELTHLIMSFGVSKLSPIGSTFKKQVMGDVDVAVKYNGTTDDLYMSVIALMGPDHVRKLPNIVSFIYGLPRSHKIVQVDMMLGDPDYLSWSRVGTSNIRSHRDYSITKGAVRNILLNAILRETADVNFPGEQSATRRVRYTRDPDKGLFRVVQTKQGTNGVLKSWKTLERSFVSSDPQEIVRIMIDDTTQPDDVLTLESLLQAVVSSSRLGPSLDAILDGFVTDITFVAEKDPYTLGDDPQKILKDILDLVDRLR